MAAKKKTGIVPAAPSTGIVKWEDEIAAEAKDLAAKYTVTSQKISFRGGKISIGGNEVQNPLPVLIADACFENALYEDAYDPARPAVPICFAFGRDEGKMAPHADSIKPQHADCKSCPLNQFGSSGNGKACKNGVRIMALSGTVTAEDVPTTEVLPAIIPPTSISNWASYVKGLRDMGLVPWACFTEIKNEPFKTWFKVSFRPVGKITQDIWVALKARRESIAEQMMQPYKAMEQAEAKPAAKKSRRF